MFDTPKAQNEIMLDKKAFQLWLQPNAPDQERNLSLKNMRMAIREELTETQKRYVVAYYVEGKKMQEIADTYMVNRATVSKTLKRARGRLHKVLRYSSRLLLCESLKR